MKVIMTDKYWYPALNVAIHFEADFKKNPPPKKAEEMLAVAVAMAGMQEMHNKEYWVQLVPDEEGSPDVRTMCCDRVKDGKAPWCYQQDVEVVTYTQFSKNENLADFVARTKLASNAAYDELTTILVHVKESSRLPTAQEWSQVLSKTRKKNPVLVLGRTHPVALDYRLAVVHPVVEGAFDYNAPQLLRKRGYIKVAKWSLGTKATEVIDNDEKHCPFEQIGVRCSLL
jgi:hypothetical protein